MFNAITRKYKFLDKMDYIEQIPDIEDYYPLFMETGWNGILNLSKQELKAAVEKSFATICVYDQSKLVGFGRVISDGIMYATIYDVMVKPEFNKQGIGKKIVQELIDKCISLNIRSLHLFAAKGTEAFYKNLDFVSRPKDAPGMKYESTKASHNALR